MKLKKLPSKMWLMLLLVLPVMLFAACSRNTYEPEPEMPFELNIRDAPAPHEPNPNELLSVHFIDVGEGDAILIVQGAYTMLVDGGSAEMGAAVFNYLRDNGVTVLNYVVVTHPFNDHIGGLPYVLQRTRVENVLLPMVYHDTTAYNAFLVAVENSGADVAVPFAGHTFNLGDAAVTVLAPNPTDVWENRANYSIVIRIEFGTTSFLLMGDAMREVEANLLDSTSALSSDVLKVARHGTSAATTTAFLDAVNPSIAVISAGGGNSFLSNEVLRRLSNADVHTFRTDLNGSVVITSDGSLLRVAVDR